VFGFLIQQFWGCPFYCQKMAFVGNFSIPHCGKYIFFQCSIALLGTRLYRHVPNSPKDKNKMMHHPCLLEKIAFWPPKLCCSPLVHGKKTFSSTLKFMVLQMVRNESVKFGRHVDKQVKHKILWLKVPNNAQTLHNPPCF
jgi:hypothetical protein